MPESNLIAVDIVALVEDPSNENPIVVLHDRSRNRLLPIWIGDAEARAIAIALNRVNTPRPLTHTLLVQVIEKMGGRLSQMVVDRLKHHTYYASLFVETAKGVVTVDARPSDALALALTARIPIFVAKDVMDSAGQNNPFPGMAMRQEKREWTEEEVKKLREMIEKAREREEKGE